MSEEQHKGFIAKVQSDNALQDPLKVEGADPAAIAKAKVCDQMWNQSKQQG